MTTQTPQIPHTDEPLIERWSRVQNQDTVDRVYRVEMALRRALSREAVQTDTGFVLIDTRQLTDLAERLVEAMGRMAEHG